MAILLRRGTAATPAIPVTPATPAMPAVIAVLAVLALSTLAVSWTLAPLLARGTSAVGPTSGDPLFTLWILEWGAAAWTRGLAGFWDAPFFFPARETIVLSDHMLLPALLHLGFRALGASPALAHNLLVILSFPLTAWAAYALLRRATRAPRGIAAALALAVTCAPWRWGQLVHLLMIWAPGPLLSLWAFDRVLARPGARRATTFVAAELVTLLSGCYLAYLTHLALLFVLAVRASRRGFLRKLRRGALPLAAAAGVVAIVGFTVYEPYLSARRAHGEKRRPQEIRGFGASTTDWLTPSPRNLYFDVLPETWHRAERDLFPGLLLAGAAIAGATIGAFSRWSPLVRHRRLPMPPLGRALVVAGGTFALLANAEIFLLVARVVPGLDSMRVPSRGQLFVLVALAVFAARALHAVQRGARTPTRRALLAAAVGGLLAVDLVAKPIDPGDVYELETKAPPHLIWLGRPAVAAVAVFPMTGSHIEGQRMWRQRWHGRPLANAYSSYLPAPFTYLRSRCRTPENRLLPRCADALSELGISHAVVEDAWYAHPGAAIGNRIEAAVRADATDRFHLEFFDAEALVFSVLPPPATSSTPPAERDEE